MFKRIFLLFLMLGLAVSGWSQQKWWVFFTDKAEVSFDPHTYFDAKAIERRMRHGLPLDHPSDWPVQESYVDQVADLGAIPGHRTRWFNGVAITADADLIPSIRSLTFVREVTPIEGTFYTCEEPTSDTLISELSGFERKILERQTARLGCSSFGEYDGSGVRVAIFDAGFPRVDEHPAFAHIRKNNRIKATYDFVRNRDDVYRSNPHGTMVLSCIAGMIDGKQVGLATGAEFLLARTENAIFEPFSEEENWLAAVEWADKNGADIINSSLGYTNRRYFTQDMDGQKSLVARAANMAARKGLLVVNAAGNDGSGNWKVIGTPADADSVLSVGGIDPFSNYHIDFSSYGPTADKRLKPNVCAFGNAIVAQKYGYGQASGTSFASPLVAGFAACAWQTNREMTNMQLFREIQFSGDLYPYFDYAHGYGVPQADHFLGKADVEPEPTFDLIQSDRGYQVVIREAWLNPEEESGGDNQSARDYRGDQHLYCHFENVYGYLDRYLVVEVEQKDVLNIERYETIGVKTLRVHYRGYTLTKELR